MSKHSFLGKIMDKINNGDDNIGDTSHISNILYNILFLGSQYASTDDILGERNITHVVSIGCDPLYKNLDNIKNYKFEIEDSGYRKNVSEYFNEVIPEIHAIIDKCVSNNEKILVLCEAGRSRSAIVIITWLMKHKKMDYETAFHYVKERRSVISPNISFVDYVKSPNKSMLVY